MGRKKGEAKVKITRWATPEQAARILGILGSKKSDETAQLIKEPKPEVTFYNALQPVVDDLTAKLKESSEQNAKINSEWDKTLKELDTSRQETAEARRAYEELLLMEATDKQKSLVRWITSLKEAVPPRNDIDQTQ